LFSIMIGYGNSMFLATHGILARTASGGGVDPDAQAFITAAAITDPTQQAAINTLVVDLKGYSIWTKMKALYPFVGGTNSQHAWNLKDTTTYKITWYGGVTSSANGILGNGTNGYGDTFLANNVMAQNDAHISLYSRTEANAAAYDMGSWDGSNFGSFIRARTSGNFQHTINSGTYSVVANSDGRGFYLVSRKNNTSITGYKNTTPYLNTFVTSISNITTSFKILRIGEYNNEYSPRNLAFASIGDGLNDTEAANFYTAVQAFQTTIGRSIGTQTVSDADAQAFVTNAGIVDQVEANAINNLVIGMKADGLWTKIKAVYPFVGGTSTSTSYNLRNTAQYQISWNGGWTWNSNGVTGNGVNGWGNTGLVPNSALTLNSTHQSLYIRNTGNLGVDDFGSATNGTTSLMRMIVKNSGTNDHFIDHYAVAQRITGTVADSTGFFVVSRENSTSLKSKRNDVSLGTNTNSNTGTLPTHALYLGALNNIGTAVNYTARNYAFASAGDGLSDTDMTNLRNRVVTFQTALNRNI
jgi:hypothetical protein